MKQSGVIMLEMGIESGSQAILDKVNKGIELTQLESILKKTTELGILVIGSLMAPHFCDTPETLKQTVNFARYLSDRYLVLSLIGRTNAHPKSEYYKLYKDEFDLKFNSEDGIIQTKYLNESQISTTIKQLEDLFNASILKNADILSKMVQSTNRT
jgi:radical SAM superfamily enzyme YgiQ (UPF0313 family)